MKLSFCQIDERCMALRRLRVDFTDNNLYASAVDGCSDDFDSVGCGRL